MDNKKVGLIIIGISLLILFIVFSYNKALETIVDTSCTHGPTCPMYATMNTQKTVSYALITLLLVGGVYVLFFLKDKTIKHEAKAVDKSKLDSEEKKIVDLLALNEGSMYQSDLIKETQFTKVKITRVLDKLEGRKVIERKRRGMANIVVLR